jgi:hypothetical protein
MIEQFQLCEWGHCQLRKVYHHLEIMSGSWDAPDYPTYQFDTVVALPLWEPPIVNRAPANHKLATRQC